MGPATRARRKHESPLGSRFPYRLPSRHGPAHGSDHDAARGVPLPAQAWRLTALLCLVSTADWYLLLVVFWIAAERNWSPVALAVLVVASRMPTLLGGLVGGRLVDVLGPRRMIQADTGVRTILLAALAVASLTHQDGYLVIVVVAGGCAAFTPLSYASSRTLIPRMVTAVQLPRANTVLSLGDSLPIVLSALIAGPALAGLGAGALIVPVLLVGAGFWLARQVPDLRADAACSTSVAGEEATGPGPGSRPRRRRIPRSAKALIALSTVYFLAYGPFQPLLPDLVRQGYGGGAGAYSAMRLFVGVGALIGLALGPALCRFGRPGVVNALGALAYGLVMLPVALVHSVPAGVSLYFLSGIVWGPYAVIEATALQRWTSPDQHGRVFGLQRALVISAIPAGGVIGSLATGHATVTTILAVSALACAATGALALLMPAIRRPAAGVPDPEIEAAASRGHRAL